MKPAAVVASAMIACTPAQAPPPAPPPAARLVVLDAESSAPLAGATVTELAMQRTLDECDGPPFQNGAAAGTTADIQSTTTDARGRAFFARDLPSDDSAHCAPGAPCAVMKLVHVIRVEKDGFVPFASSALGASTVRLLGPRALVRDRHTAVAIALGDAEVARLRRHLRAEPEPWFLHGERDGAEPRSCLGPDGVWSVSLAGAMLRGDRDVPFVPSVTLEIDPFTRAARFVSCPEAGSPFEVIDASERSVHVRDRLTGIAYACAGCSSEPRGAGSWCERALAAGERMTDIGLDERRPDRCAPAPGEAIEIALGEHVPQPAGGVFGRGHAVLRACRAEARSPRASTDAPDATP